MRGALEGGKAEVTLGGALAPRAHELERGLVHPDLPVFVAFALPHGEAAGLQIDLAPGET